MNLVDSSGWLEYFADGKNAKHFAEAIEDTQNLAVSVINLYEIYKKVLKERNEYDAKQAVALMMQGKVIDLDASLSLKAAEISHNYDLPMADSLIYATAQNCEATLWTQDYDFKGLDGVKLIKKQLFRFPPDRIRSDVHPYPTPRFLLSELCEKHHELSRQLFAEDEKHASDKALHLEFLDAGIPAFHPAQD